MRIVVFSEEGFSEHGFFPSKVFKYYRIEGEFYLHINKVVSEIICKMFFPYENLPSVELKLRQ